MSFLFFGRFFWALIDFGTAQAAVILASVGTGFKGDPVGSSALLEDLSGAAEGIGFALEADVFLTASGAVSQDLPVSAAADPLFVLCTALCVVGAVSDQDSGSGD